jgi:hypothetical protein
MDVTPTTWLSVPRETEEFKVTEELVQVYCGTILLPFGTVSNIIDGRRIESLKVMDIQ